MAHLLIGGVTNSATLDNHMEHGTRSNASYDSYDELKHYDGFNYGQPEKARETGKKEKSNRFKLKNPWEKV